MTYEHQQFIERYEWLGNPGFGIKWCFTARYKNLLGGVILFSEPYRFENNETRHAEALIQRGACASWAPKNLNSHLIMYACRWMAQHTDKRVFFAYSDPAAGEIGTVYQACNFYYLGQFKKQVYTHKGKVKSAQTAKRTRHLLPWLAKQDITLPSSCFTPKGYFRWSAIPLAIKTKMREHIRLKITKWQRQDSRHGKYVLILGPNRTETKRWKRQYTFKSVPYTKRSIPIDPSGTTI